MEILALGLVTLTQTKWPYNEHVCSKYICAWFSHIDTNQVAQNIYPLGAVTLTQTKFLKIHMLSKSCSWLGHMDTNQVALNAYITKIMPLGLVTLTHAKEV